MTDTMNDAVQENHISLSELHETPEFKSLTANQQNWFDRYATTGDPRRATVESYPRAKKLGPAYTSQLMQKLLSAPRVRAVLACYWQLDGRQKFLADLEIDIRRAKGSDKASLQMVRAKVLGLVPGDDASILAAEPEQQTFPVGATVEQDGHRYRITAVEIE